MRAGGEATIGGLMTSATPPRVALVILLCASLSGCGMAEGAGPTIQLQSIGAIGSDGGEGALSSGPSSIARDSAGRWLVATPSQASPELPGIYSPSGRFLRRIGTLGDGPGEYRRVSHIVRTRGDTILFVDEAARRLSVLSPGLAYVTSVPLPTWPHDVSAAPDGGLFISAPSFDRSAAGPAVLHVTRQGVVEAGYGATDRPCAQRCSSERARLMAPTADGVWLVARFFTPVVERWTLDGRRNAVFEIHSEWFPPYDSIRGPTPERPPAAMLTGAWIDGHGRLWTLGQTADPEWKNGLGPAEHAREGGGLRYPMTVPTDVVNAFIEVRDTVTGSLVARRRLDDAYYLMHIDGNVIGRVRETDDGWVVVDLLEVSMTGN